MYTVYSDKYLLYDSRLPEYVLTEPLLSMSANEPCHLSFGIPSINPNAGTITRLKSRIKVYRDGQLIFLGRVIEDVIELNSQRRYVAEDALAFLLDSIQRPFSFEGTVFGLFSQLILSHNKQVNDEQKLLVGSVTVESDQPIALSSNEYPSTWAVIKEQLLDVLGGFLVVRFNAKEQPVLHYLKDPPDTATQHIKFSENLRELVISRNADETYTACIPLGATWKEIDENADSDERLTIASANGGIDFLVDSKNAETYGTIFAPVEFTTFPDEKNAAYLMQRGRAWLSKSGARLKKSITLKAVDLHSVDADIEAFSFLDRVIVSCGEVCPMEEFILTGMEIPLNDPGSTSITLGDTKPSLIGDGANQQMNAIHRIESIEADYVTNQEVSAIVNEQVTNNTSILQSAQQIIMSALAEYVRTSDFESFQSTIQTTLSIMAGTIEANFYETTSEISNLNGDMSQRFETIHSFIRLISSGIVLGKSSSDIKLKLENDILYFFTGEEDSVSTDNSLAYFSAGKLYVNDVQILTSMRIGPFSWTLERDNLNFKLMQV